MTPLDNDFGPHQGSQYMNNWLTEDLKQEIRKVFESRYGRILLDLEVLEIAENLTVGMEEILKFKFRQYEKIAR